jgi:S1-C subfamily serine protease
MNEHGDRQPAQPVPPTAEPEQSTQPPAPGATGAGPAEGLAPGWAPQADWPAPTVPARAAPTWHWTGTYPNPAPASHPGAGWGYPPPYAAAPPAQTARGSVPRRTKVLAGVAALALAAAGAAGGAAFEYSHTRAASSASGIAGGSGQTSQGSSGSAGQSPSQGGQPDNPFGGGSGRHGNGRASRFSTPGHASAAQSVGVVDIYTKLKYEGARAAGTGMIVASDGEVLTNNHVIEGATKIKVRVVSTGQKYTATVVGTDKVDDVAVLQLSGASALSTVTTDTGTVAVGDPVTAVGNAMGAGGVPSAAKGTVTGLDRSITTQSEGGVDGERLTGMIEVDAQVVSGDSGGPLYDANGEVVGVDTAASASPARTVGFAIPIGKAMSLADRIEAGDGGGNVTIGSPAFLGVQFSAGAYSQTGKGALVSGVLRKTPAAGAGMIAGDTITKVGGTPVVSGEQLRQVLSQYKPGQTAAVTWLDTQGGSHTAAVTLTAGPAE